jgi:two-component system phosphate regulon response regulator PhoB
VQPISAKDLLVRIRAFLKLVTPESSIEPLIAGSIELCRDERRVRRSGREIRLARTEFRLLEQLMEKPGFVFARKQLRSCVWGNSTEIDERTVDVHIGRLRKALSIDGESDPIRTVRGSGYSFDATLAGQRS